MRVRLTTSLLLLVTLLGGAEPALQPPAPLAELSPAQPSVSAGSVIAQQAAAERALAMGFPSIAISLYEPLVSLPGINTARLRLELATAQMEDGRLEEAGKTLEGILVPRDAGWHLRAGLLASHTRKLEQARSHFGQIRPDELDEADKGWYHFLQGILADAAGNFRQGGEHYAQAVASAQTAIVRVRFQLALQQAMLRRGVANLEQQRTQAEQYQGQRLGHEAALQYAVGLDAGGRKAEAVEVLQRLLASLPVSETQLLDRVRLMLGLIDGVGQGAQGRNALLRLLESGQDEEGQRIALHLLAGAGAAPDLQAKLDQLIALATPHRILESLLLYRAQIALLGGDYPRAEADARALLDRFPGSQLRVQALGVLTSAAWDQRRYRLAADNAEKARQALAPGAVRARLGLLVAEAWYRAGGISSAVGSGDYASAADAYAAVLRDPPPGIPLGLLMYQRVLAEIDAGRPLEAQALLDTLSRNAAFDPDSRWQAEWNLARALQVSGHVDEALARVASMLGAPVQAGDPELRARMAWLQLRLSLDARRPEDVLRLGAGLGPLLERLAAPLRAEIASSALLLQAQAEFSLAHPDQALSLLQQLRSEYPGGPAAVYSMIIEADHYATQDRMVDAQQRLTEVADQYKDSPYAPYALFRACLLAERRGQDSNYVEANRLIEDLVSRYPNSDLVFYARLKQGDIWRKLNRFALAEQVYDHLVKHYPQHADVLAARMSLADCHSAQAVSDPSRIDRALDIYEGLLARPDASPDLRIEAGFKLGSAHIRRGEIRRAIDVWWRDVVSGFLANPSDVSRIGANGRYWMGRVLRDLGAQLEQQGRNDEARRAWTLVLDSGLPGAAFAKARLERMRLEQPTTTPQTRQP